MNELFHNDPGMRLGEEGRVPRLAAGIVAVAGLGLAAVLYFTHAMPADRFFRSYLVGFMLVLGISLAALVFVMIMHAVRAGWIIVVRRLLEVLASNLIWLWVLFVPLAVAMFLSSKTHLYEWALPGVADPGAAAYDALLAGKASFLNQWFWLARAVVLFAIWGVLARFYLSNSTTQDETGDLVHTHRMQRWAPLGILLFALTSTLAAVDWMMSLEPHWFSTIWGVYFFAGSCAACFSTWILICLLLQRLGKLRDRITLEHYQEMGKMLFAFGVVFWAYIGFSQFMLIWYANIPEETTFFLIRGRGGWWGLSLLLILGHFMVPFLALLSRHPKRRKPALAVAAGWMLLMAVADFYWLIVPQVPADLLAMTRVAGGVEFQAFAHEYHNGLVPADTLAAKHLPVDRGLTYEQVYGPSLFDLACVPGLLGLYLWVTFVRLGRSALMPLRDPRLQESMAFENI